MVRGRSGPICLVIRHGLATARHVSPRLERMTWARRCRDCSQQSFLWRRFCCDLQCKNTSLWTRPWHAALFSSLLRDGHEKLRFQSGAPQKEQSPQPQRRYAYGRSGRHGPGSVAWGDARTVWRTGTCPVRSRSLGDCAPWCWPGGSRQRKIKLLCRRTTPTSEQEASAWACLANSYIGASRIGLRVTAVWTGHTETSGWVLKGNCNIPLAENGRLTFARSCGPRWIGPRRAPTVGAFPVVQGAVSCLAGDPPA